MNFPGRTKSRNAAYYEAGGLESSRGLYYNSVTLLGFDVNAAMEVQRMLHDTVSVHIQLHIRLRNFDVVRGLYGHKVEKMCRFGRCKFKLRGDIQSIRLFWPFWAFCPAQALPIISHVFGYEFIDYHCQDSGVMLWLCRLRQ